MPHPCPHHCPPEGDAGAALSVLAVTAAAAVAVSTVVAFIATHIVILAAAAAVFAAVMGGLAAWMRWAASPARRRRHYYARPTVKVLPSRPAQPITAPQRKEIAQTWRVVSVERCPARR